MGRATKKFKIFYGKAFFVAVFVMDNFMAFKGSAKMLFHNETVQFKSLAFYANYWIAPPIEKITTFIKGAFLARMSQAKAFTAAINSRIFPSSKATFSLPKLFITHRAMAKCSGYIGTLKRAIFLRANIMEKYFSTFAFRTYPRIDDSRSSNFHTKVNNLIYSHIHSIAYTLNYYQISGEVR